MVTEKTHSITTSVLEKQSKWQQGTLMTSPLQSLKNRENGNIAQSQHHHLIPYRTEQMVKQHGHRVNTLVLEAKE